MTHENYIKVQYVRDLLNLNESLFNFICDVQNVKEKINKLNYNSSAIKDHCNIRNLFETETDLQSPAAKKLTQEFDENIEKFKKDSNFIQELNKILTKNIMEEK